MLKLTKVHARYPSSTPTGIDWLGEIPSGWEKVKV